MKKVVLLVALLGVVQVFAHMSMEYPQSRTYYQGRRYARWEWNEPMVPAHPQPCHSTDPDGSVPPSNVFREGERITVRLAGSAFHNGGHCAVWYTNTENGVWYKIVDVKDCTVPGIGANFPVTLPPGMGRLCSDRCVFAWTWTPRVSGACEIYMTCADVRVTGSGSAPANLVQLNFASLIQNYGCRRVDPGTHLTTHFGELRLFGVNPTPTPPPVNFPTPRPTMPPPTPQPTRSTVPVGGCTLNYPCYVKVGASSSVWWLSFYVKDIDDNTVDATKFEVAGQGHQFLEMTKQPWGPFQESMPQAVQLPLSVRITTSQSVFYACNAIDSLTSGKKYQLQQNSPCSEAQGAPYTWPKYSTDPSKIEETSGDGKDGFTQGDIRVDAYVADQLQLSDYWAAHPGISHAAISGTSRLWPSGVVVYTYDGSINSERRTAIETAMAHIAQRTVISFRQRSSERDYVTFSAAQSGCWSYVGKTGGQQTVNVESRCPWPTVVHEILHALGFWHEQSRPDRDNYVTIMWNNINEANKHNFNKKTWNDVDDRGHSYDFNSVMHYGAYAFSNNGQKTIVTKNGASIGQRNGLSAVDVNEVNAVYGPLTGNPGPQPTPRPTAPAPSPTPRPTDGGSSFQCYQNVPCYIIVASNANNNWFPIYFQDGFKSVVQNSDISTVHIRPNGWSWVSMDKNSNPWFTYYSPNRALGWPLDIRFYHNGKWKVACNRVTAVGGSQRTYFGFVDGWDCASDPMNSPNSNGPITVGNPVSQDGVDV